MLKIFPLSINFFFFFFFFFFVNFISRLIFLISYLIFIFIWSCHLILPLFSIVLLFLPKLVSDDSFVSYCVYLFGMSALFKTWLYLFVFYVYFLPSYVMRVAKLEEQLLIIDYYLFFFASYFQTFQEFKSFRFIINFYKLVDIFIINSFLFIFLFLGFSFLFIVIYTNEFLFFYVTAFSNVFIDSLDLLGIFNIVALNNFSFFSEVENTYDSVVFFFNEANFISFFLFDELFIYLFITTLVLLLGLIVAVSFSVFSKNL